MNDPIKRVLWPLALVFGIAGSVVAAPPVLTMGEGMGIVDGYDRAQGVVLIGRQQVGLSPAAAASLEQQLAYHRLAANQRFAAKYNIVNSGGGGLVLESIYVVPPKGP